MRIVDAGEVRAFRAHGYVLLPAVQPPPAGHAGPHFLWPRFGGDPHPLLDYYRDAGPPAIAASLLRPDLTVDEPDFAQLATTIPPWPHRPGGPHVDGLTPPPPD